MSSTTNVTVLSPPAVEPEDPPISIRKMETAFPAEVSRPWSTPANPAVRSVMDWKKAASSFCGTFSVPSVEGFRHSIMQNRIVPPASSTPVVIMTSLV